VEQAGLSRARALSRWLNLSTYAIAVWALFEPTPYALVVGVLVCMPWLAVFLVGRSKGLLLLDPDPKETRPGLAQVFLIPAGALTLRGVMDLEVMNWTGVGLVALGIGSVLCLAALKADPTIRARGWEHCAIFLVFSSVYGIGVTLEANALLDRSSPVAHQARVTGKQISGGRRVDYQLNIDPWGPVREPTTVRVDGAFYDAIQPGDRVCLDLHQGALRLSWYAVRPCQ